MTKKRIRTRILEDVKKAIEKEFGNRVVMVSYGSVPNEWVASHSSMEVKVVVKRLNPALINNIYDVVYKIMYKNNFNFLISLRIMAWGNKTVKEGDFKEEGIWTAV